MTPMLAKVLDESPDGIIVHDGECILNVNAAVIRLVGAASRNDVVGRPIGDLLEYPHLKWVERRLMSDAPITEGPSFAPERLYALDGSIRDVEAHAQIVLDKGRPSVFVWVHDLREQHEDEQKLLAELRRQCAAEARANITRIAGGVAHTINNRLQVVRGFSDLLGDSSLTSEQQLDINEIVRAADEAAQVTRQLMQFAGALPLAKESVAIDALVRRAVEGLGAQDADLLWRLSVATEAVEHVQVDPLHLRQVLVALIANARTATQAGGRIMVSVAESMLPSPLRSTDGRRIDRGQYVVLKVRDTGTGMALEDQMWLFTPFFTTSPVGEGNGMGLAVVEALLRQNSAFLTFSSSPGVGTTFVCWFRKGGEPELAVEAACAPDTRYDPLSIMLVDEAGGMQSMVVRGLEELGHRVLLLRSEAEVLEVARHVGAPALVVISASIDRQSPRFARRLRAQWPGLPILILAGAPAPAALGAEPARADVRGVHRLPPPFSEYMLVSLIQSLLAERGVAESSAS